MAHSQSFVVLGVQFGSELDGFHQKFRSQTERGGQKPSKAAESHQRRSAIDALINDFVGFVDSSKEPKQARSDSVELRKAASRVEVVRRIVVRWNHQFACKYLVGDFYDSLY